MWACCDDTSFDDHEHNTSKAFLLLCADAPIALVLLGSPAWTLKVVLCCRFALDVFFTVAQQDYPLADQDSLKTCTLIGPVSSRLS